jgi:DNA-binding PucR family transcriptional regulator
VEEQLGRVAGHFEAQLGVLADQIVSRMRNEISEASRLDAPELWDAVRRVTVQGRLSQARSLRNGRAIPERLSDADAEAVHMAVHGGISLSGALHAYRIGHDVSLEAWIAAVDDLPLADDERSRATRSVVRFVLAYDDRLARLIEQEFEAERTRVIGKSDQVRLRAMMDVIEGVSGSAAQLDYDLGLEHVGLIAWGDDPDSLLQSLSKELNARLISAPTPAGFRWGWLGSPSFDSEKLRKLRGLVPSNGTAVAVGQPETGIEGFRRTHRQAGAAHVVASRRAQPVTHYEDVALEALALRDESAAGEFVDRVLQGINGDDARSVGLRGTLTAYFISGQNAASTAAALRVHEATIARRLAEVEKRTGQRLNQRRAELETALRLRSLLLPE